ncbi:PREDICTED: monocarboxylate transporter 12-like [Priapulus caudatus]|uniref:Monocarboxylate transporter 12-like n=1 Tax=Priapulus caudatus TaxID=37621 RepID=A0ABM1DV30_PRICU|nr:PREDICTED: monocarboxylate transporter 12-like [Priapulus caudatus]
MGFILTPSIAIVGYYFDKYRPLASVLTSCAHSAGTMVAPMVTVAFIDSFTWHGALLITAGVCMHMVLGGMLFRPLPVAKTTNGTVRKKTAALSSGAIKKLALYCVTAVCFNAGSESILMFSIKYGLELGIPIETVAQLCIIRDVSSTLIRFTVAIISGSSCFNRRIAFASGISLGGAAALLFFFAPSRALYPVLLCVYGLGSGVTYSLGASVNVDLFGVGNLLTIEGIVNFAAGCASFIGPLIAGAMVDQFGNTRSAFLFGGIMLLTSALFFVGVLLLNRRQVNIRRASVASRKASRRSFTVANDDDDETMTMTIYDDDDDDDYGCLTRTHKVQRVGM